MFRNNRRRVLEDEECCIFDEVCPGCRRDGCPGTCVRPCGACGYCCTNQPRLCNGLPEEVVDLRETEHKEALNRG